MPIHRISAQERRKDEYANPLHPGNYPARQSQRMYSRQLPPTFPQGFAIKLGIIPCCIPMLLTENLNSCALSAMRSALVYARAASYTPGPVSVWCPSSGTSNLAVSSKMSLK